MGKHRHTTAPKKRGSESTKRARFLLFCSWIRRCLFQLNIKKGDFVCQVCYDKDHDPECADRFKLQERGIAQFVGLDPSDNSSKLCAAIWRDSPGIAHFYVNNLFENSIQPNHKVLLPARFDVIYCPDILSHCYSTRRKAEDFLNRVSYLLKEGGRFIGYCPDPSEISIRAKSVCRGRPSSEKGCTIHNIRYTIQLDSLPVNPQFGIRYHVKVLDLDTRTHYMIHFETLQRIAEKAGLEMMEITNFSPFYEEFANLKMNERSMESNDDDSFLIRKYVQNSRDLIGLYTTFVFRKRFLGKA